MATIDHHTSSERVDEYVPDGSAVWRRTTTWQWSCNIIGQCQQSPQRQRNHWRYLTFFHRAWIPPLLIMSFSRHDGGSSNHSNPSSLSSLFAPHTNGYLCEVWWWTHLEDKIRCNANGSLLLGGFDWVKHGGIRDVLWGQTIARRNCGRVGF